jgi:hypothetical protein
VVLGGTGDVLNDFASFCIINAIAVTKGIKMIAVSSVLLVEASAATGYAQGTCDAFDSTGIDCIVVVMGALDRSPSDHVQYVDDNKGNTYQYGTLWGPHAANRALLIAYCNNPTVGTGHTINVTAASPGLGESPSGIILNLTGVNLTAPFDQESEGDFVPAVGGPTSVTIGTVTPTEDNEIVIFGIIDDTITDSSHGTISVATGFTFAGSVTAGDTHGTGNHGQSMAVFYKVQTTAGAEAITYTTATTYSALLGATATFKAAGAGGGGGPNLAVFENHYRQLRGN